MKQQSKKSQQLLSKRELGAFEIEMQHGHVNGKSIRAKTWDESKKMWKIAAPAVAQFSIQFVTITFVGHLGEVELVAVSVVQNVLEGFVFGIMVSSVCNTVTPRSNL
ncbi:UNVERIFIED_CONTAM: protein DETOXIFICATION 26 [Sesamum radiatum]|uniref:Protein DETOXIFICATION 26 n=1 Tax=Sesamum radiatum TaxID=300843 RepID=A0AAW2RVL1_SESRA